MSKKYKNKTADTFFALAHSKRICILEVLLKQMPRKASFGELQRNTGIAASTLVHHLREMENGNVIIQNPAGASTEIALNLNHLQKTLADMMESCSKNSMTTIK